MRKEEALEICAILQQNNPTATFEVVQGSDGHYTVTDGKDFTLRYSWQWVLMRLEGFEQNVITACNQIGEVLNSHAQGLNQIGGMVGQLTQQAAPAEAAKATLVSPSGLALIR